MQVSLVTSGLLDPANLRAWTVAAQQRINAGVARAMRIQSKIIATAAQQQAAQVFGGKQNAAKSIRAKVYDSKPNSLPAFKIGSKIPWLGIHQRGGTISGKNMLVPFGGSRPKRFRFLIQDLMRSGNAYFRQVGGHAILFAENIPENARLLVGFKRTARTAGIVETKGKSGKSVRRGTDIPVAVLVNRVTVRKKLRLIETVTDALPTLARAIETELERG